MAIRSSIKVHASPERTFQAWIQTKDLVKWFPPQAHVEPCEGGAYELYFNPADHDVDSTKGCRIFAFEAPNRLGFTWKGPQQLAAVMNDEANLTRVEVTITPADHHHTEVTVVHSGWGEGDEWEKARQWHVMAWDMMLQRLALYIKDAGKGVCSCCQ